MKSWIGCAVLLTLAAVWTADALPAQAFEPLRDTLAHYNMTGTPQASDYPDVPAVGILSIQEFRQMGRTHLLLSHEIIKILTPAGKSYTTVKVPCYTECRAEGRTIKPDGRIVNVPARDLIHTRQVTGYNAPYSFEQFAVPAVEPGDTVEIKTTVLVPVTLFIEDFRFPKSYPVQKSVMILSHPPDDTYTYSLQGRGRIQVSERTDTASGTELQQTFFEMNNVPASVAEPYSAGAQQEEPGVRVLMTGRSGTQFEVFKDWFSYGKFISDRSKLEALNPGEVKNFVKETVGASTGDQEILRLIYQAADRQILISSDSLIDAGFEFIPPEKVLERKAARPHEFAMFLAACYRVQKWTTELVLVNSHNLPETSKERPFPLDLDLVFLNVKTPSGEFLLDCTRNGMPFGILSSPAMNRFALVIPVATAATTIPVSPYLTTMPFRSGNVNHIDMIWTPDPSYWNIDFRWFLGGELQSSFLSESRRETEPEFRKDIAYYVRTRLHADDIREVSYRWLAGGIELHGKARVARRKLGGGCELVQNNSWDAGFDYRQYLFEKRTSPFLLPMTGEISSTVTINVEPSMIPMLPASTVVDFKPVRYTMTAGKAGTQVTISEKIDITDLLIRPPAFAGFTDFLDRYYAGHFWSLLLTPAGNTAPGALP